MKSNRTKTLSFGLIALAVFPLALGYAQVAAAPPAPVAASPAAMPADLPTGAAEVVKLAQLGVGDDVVLAFIKSSQTPYNLSADNIVYLKSAGLSAPVLAAMMNHDAALRTSPAAAAPAAPAAPATPAYEQKLYAPGQPYPVEQAAPAAAPAPPAVVPPPPAPAVTTVVPVRPTSLIVEQAPPPPRPEVVPLAPGPDYAWAPGHWYYQGGNWLWIAGCWKPRPGPSAVWVGPYWAHHGHSYIYVKGRWRW